MISPLTNVNAIIGRKWYCIGLNIALFHPLMLPVEIQLPFSLTINNGSYILFVLQ
uniref:Uncharacterized protein n=1 Tax=Octopus bimaculoides TaxID=37653 RepID=A0A0L8FK94_OCTBM